MVNDQELKAGHAPATKVGGARRTRNRSRSDNVGGMAGEPAPEEVTPGEEGTEETPAEEVKDVQTADQSVVPPFKENTPAAVKSYHEKPAPTKNIQVTKNPQTSSNNMNIQQPRK